MRPIALILALAACSSPSLKYTGQEATRAEINGWVIDVYQKGTQAQAIRLNSIMLPAPEDMHHYGTIAMERATGCKVIPSSKKGDAVVLNAKLRCPNA